MQCVCVDCTDTVAAKYGCTQERKPSQLLGGTPRRSARLIQIRPADRAGLRDVEPGPEALRVHPVPAGSPFHRLPSAQLLGADAADLSLLYVLLFFTCDYMFS